MLCVLTECADPLALVTVCCRRVEPESGSHQLPPDGGTAAHTHTAACGILTAPCKYPTWTTPQVSCDLACILVELTHVLHSGGRIMWMPACCIEHACYQACTCVCLQRGQISDLRKDVQASDYAAARAAKQQSDELQHKLQGIIQQQQRQQQEMQQQHSALQQQNRLLAQQLQRQQREFMLQVCAWQVCNALLAM